MALRQEPATGALEPILDEIARALGGLGLSDGSSGAGKGTLRVVWENDVKRVVQAYWTPFEASVPGPSVGLHLEVPGPPVRWAEGYLTPAFRNWFFAFQERPDGEVQLAHYQDYPSPGDALARFFNLASWYVLVAAGLTWKDIVLEVDPELGWSEHQQSLASPITSAAVQESLKKSTIIWLNWRDASGVERTMPVWFLFDSKTNRIFVLSGERQQTIPDAENLRNVVVILRWKGKNAQIAELPASVRVLPQGDEWNEWAEKIAEKRLNIPGLPEDTARRWRDECHILELTLQT